MLSRIRLWWQKQKLLLTSTALVAIFAFIAAGYLFHWGWTGFSTKTLWEWMQLLIAPLVIALVVWWLTLRQQEIERKAAEQREEADRKAAEQREETERRIADDRRNEANLHAYLDAISTLLVNHGLRTSSGDAEVRQIARARTLTLLSTLDEFRKRDVLQFLYEASLIEIGIGGSIIDLRGANLSEANLSGMKLSRANLSQANLDFSDLRGTDLSGADLHETNLYGAALEEVNLRGANLRETVLSQANLKDACYTDEQLAQTPYKKNITLRDGSKLLESRTP